MKLRKRVEIILLFVALFLAISMQNSSEAANITVAKVSDIKVTSITKSTAKISWKKMKNITGYRIYIKSASDKTYSTYGYSQKNWIKLENLNIATNYKIKIKAYKKIKGKRYYGKYSDVKRFVTTPKQVKNVTVVSNSDSSVNLSWEKVKKATAYRVYIYDENIKDYKYFAYAKQR